MSSKLGDWLDERTNYRSLLNPIRRRVLPSGASWGYASAPCLLWLLIVVVVTGVLMTGSYSASTTSAWASVHYIEQSPTGSFIRGLHYYGAHALIVLFALHTIRVLAVAAFRAPRELVWITGLLLMPLTLVWAITGNPLSGTQKGFSQIEVEGNIIASTPLIGPLVQRVLIGGDEVGNMTLTHLYSLHVIVLPVFVGLLLVFHISQVYKHGPALASENSRRPARPYWPYQTARNMTVFGIVFGAIAALAWFRGVPLDAPADPQLPHWTRPEWYFLFLFELRSYFVGQWEFVATAVIPVAALLLLIGMPAIDRISSRPVSGVFRGVVIVAGIAGWAWLTLASVLRDQHDAAHQNLIAESEALSARAWELADEQGVSPDGAIALLRNDPQTQGPRLFRKHCVSCHDHLDANGQGIAAEESSAPNLYGFASRDWLAGLFEPETIASDHYYGKTEFAEGEMVGFVQDMFADLDEGGEKTREQVIAALSAEANLASQTELDEAARQDGTIEAGVTAMIEEFACTDCHKLGDEGDIGYGPDLTGYGSAEWLRAFISNPEHQRFYPDTNDRMPAFSVSEDDPARKLLTYRELDLLVRWLRRDHLP